MGGSSAFPHPPSTEEYLISLTLTFVNLFNARMYNHNFFRTHLTPDILNDMDGNLSHGVEVFIRGYKAVADGSPDFHAAIYNETATVDEKEGTGWVILSQDLQRYSLAGRRMAGSIMYTWERRPAGWVCVNFCMIYGTPQFLP